MSDQRTRELERAAAQGDTDARAALVSERCRRREQHRWSCWATDGGWSNTIWCIDCLAQRPKDEHEREVESYLVHLAGQASEAYARAIRRHGRGGSADEYERLTTEIARLSGALLDYRYAIAPHIVIALPVDRVVGPPSPTAT